MFIYMVKCLSCGWLSDSLYGKTLVTLKASATFSYSFYSNVCILTFYTNNIGSLVECGRC